MSGVGDAVMAIVALGVIVSGVLLLAVWCGALAYALWRVDQREGFRKKGPIEKEYGPYVSPFPWHRAPVPVRQRKDVA